MLADPMQMSAEFLQRMAARCRELANRIQNESAREQLRLWAAEFEDRAARADIEEQSQQQ